MLALRFECHGIADEQKWILGPEAQTLAPVEGEGIERSRSARCLDREQVGSAVARATGYLLSELRSGALGAAGGDELDELSLLHDRQRALDDKGRIRIEHGNVHRSRQREKFVVKIQKVDEARCVLAVRAVVERRHTGGPRMIRWERVGSDGRLEKQLIDRIKEGL